MAGERLCLAVMGHNGLGDHIICQGLYRTLAEDWDIKLLVTYNVLGNVKLMLADLPQITVISMKDDGQILQYCKGINNQVILKLGLMAEDGFQKDYFDQEFYRQAMVPFKFRWQKFQCPNVPQVPVPEGKYVFVHDRPELNGARLTMPGIRPDPNVNIFSYRDMILKASTIHCVSSAFAALADSLPLNGTQLNFYAFGREVPKHKLPWNVRR